MRLEEHSLKIHWESIPFQTKYINTLLQVQLLRFSENET